MLIARYAKRACRLFTAPIRDLPDFVVIGAQKAGTTSLHYYLSEHPNILMGTRKEVHFFDREYKRGVLWYRSSFPLRGLSNAIIGETTPNYIFHPCVPERMASLLPSAKLIAVLRNPVERAISHYFHAVRRGYEDLPIEEALMKEDERLAGEQERLMRDQTHDPLPYLRHSYLGRGRYAEQLDVWLRHYPREQLLVLRSEDLSSVTQETVGRTFSFLKCEPCAVRVDRRYNQHARPDVSSEIREWLLEYYKPHNARLADALGVTWEEVAVTQ